ncbi:hypothetical protein T01_6559 [Trichinella spiralis]|uniref:Uncharacterized protein n=2 Tax=Trichinella spiralis TaxID=6334 RepID=A0A0V1AMA4_TRISP|nr:hypothetical protein T01_6559 [Trichinella spiralis]
MAPTTAVWLNVNVGEVIGKNTEWTNNNNNHPIEWTSFASEFKYFTMLESDELICLSSHLLDSNTLRGLYKVDKVAFLSHLVGDMHISMVSRIVMSMARILIYVSAHQFFQICYAPGSG